MKTPTERYKRRIYHYQALLNKQTEAVNKVSNLRLATFVLGAGLAIFLYIVGSPYIATGTVVIFGGIFLFLMVRHNQWMNHQRYTKTLLDINETSLLRIEGKWKLFKETGEAFLDGDHPFAGDLDLFGQGSLFQWINTAGTARGKQKLATMLADPDKSLEAIYLRQEAIMELRDKLNWRQGYEAEGRMTHSKETDPQELHTWGRARNSFYMQSWVKKCVLVLPIVTALVFVLYYLLPTIPYYIPAGAVGIQILILRYRNKERSAVLNTVFQFKNSLRVYEKMLETFEKEKFSSSYIQKLQQDLKDRGGKSAFEQIGRLVNIVEGISNRYNAAYMFVNILILWDYRSMIALEKWRAESGKKLLRWLEIIGEIEALSSMAVIGHDHKEWAMPKIVEGGEKYRAKGMGHPLLGESRVTNDLFIEAPSDILLITGSNMSGKSTLLRTAGLNLVLAYAGAPVCARGFYCSLMDIYTCMRVSDNLEQSISSFYAEILRIKGIVEAAKEERSVFFLLDEIFKGTNSQDRHGGAKALINQLSRAKAIGMVSTHDLELGAMEEESGGRIKNYHFREYYKNEQIHFDYTLRPGIATTRNAIYLIRMAGIEVEQ